MDKFEELKEPCKTLIEKGICLGCSALENPYFVGNKDCRYSKTHTAQESIEQIKENLEIQEKLKL